MLTTRNIHAADSGCKLISCLSFPVHFLHFVTFIIKLILSQILTLGAVRKAKTAVSLWTSTLPPQRQGFCPAAWSIRTALGGMEVLMLQSTACPVSAAGLCPQSDCPTLCKSLHLKKASQERFPLRPGEQLSSLCYHWLSLLPHPNPIASLCLYSQGSIPSLWMYFSEVPCSPVVLNPLPPKSYILPKVCRLLLKIEYALAVCLAGQRAYCLSSLMSLLLLVSAGCFLGI